MFALQNELFIFEKEIKAYEDLLEAYRQKITDRMALTDLREYNEIFFSAHSCAIEGNSFFRERHARIEGKRIECDSARQNLSIPILI